jgi:hypothetical protein
MSLRFSYLSAVMTAIAALAAAFLMEAISPSPLQVARVDVERLNLAVGSCPGGDVWEPLAACQQEEKGGPDCPTKYYEGRAVGCQWMFYQASCDVEPSDDVWGEGLWGACQVLCSNEYWHHECAVNPADSTCYQPALPSHDLCPTFKKEAQEC